MNSIKVLIHGAWNWLLVSFIITDWRYEVAFWVIVIIGWFIYHIIFAPTRNDWEDEE